MKRCPYCGDHIKPDQSDCPHCGQPIGKPNKNAEDQDNKKSSVDLDAWKQKSVPSWMMYLFVGLALFCLWILISEGCKRADNPQQNQQDSARYRLPPKSEELTSLSPASTPGMSYRATCGAFPTSS